MLRRFSTVVGCVSVAVFMGVATAAAQDRPVPAADPHETQESAKGPGLGIKVHGHWTIDVRNPDGSLASHNEFENAFMGHQPLSGILARRLQITGYEFQL